MRPLAVLLATAALLAGCGDSEKAASPAPTKTPSASPTTKPVDEACKNIGAQLPGWNIDGSWARVQREAEVYATSTDADARDLANDLLDFIEPLVVSEDSPGSFTDEQRVSRAFNAGWPAFVSRCSGWPELTRPEPQDDY